MGRPKGSKNKIAEQKEVKKSVEKPVEKVVMEKVVKKARGLSVDELELKLDRMRNEFNGTPQKIICDEVTYSVLIFTPGFGVPEYRNQKITGNKDWRGLTIVVEGKDERLEMI